MPEETLKNTVRAYMLGIAADTQGAGKDTLFKLLQDAGLPVDNIKFADTLTREVLGMFDHLMPYADLVELRNDRITKDAPLSCFALKNCRNSAYVKWALEHLGATWEGRLSIRQHMLWFGTGFTRGHLGQEDHYLDAGLRAARDSFSAGRIPVITDVRFPNEFARIRRIGGHLVHIEAPWVTACGDPSQIAEGHLKGLTFDAHIKNSLNDPSTMKDQLYAHFHFQ